MRTRINDYSIIEGRQIDSKIHNLTIEDIRLIVNETKKIVIASSMQKDNIVDIDNGIITYKDTIPESSTDDQMTIEIDKGDSINTSINTLLNAYDENIAMQLQTIIG